MTDRTYTAIPLWPDGAPGSEGHTGAEIVEAPNAEHHYTKLWNIHNPSLLAYPAPTESANGAAMIIAPGGANMFLAIDHEGYHIAEYMNSIGVSAFILKYRLGRQEGSPYEVDVHTRMDGQRAVRLVRSRAAEWGIDPGRVVMMGFSAGAGVTQMTCSQFDAGDPDAADPVERYSSRPDFQALIYGGWNGRETFGPQTPPTFLLCAADDDLVNASLPEVYQALREAGVSVEMHIYADGGHGFGIRKPPPPHLVASTWQDRLAEWLRARGALG